MKDKVNNFEENSIWEMYKVVNEFKNYQPRAYIIKKDAGTIVADATSILSRWKHFNRNLLKVYQSTILEESEIYTAETHITEPSLLEVAIVVENLKKFPEYIGSHLN